MNQVACASRESGRRLYREIWATVNRYFYDAARLTEVDWASKEFYCDERIVDDTSALSVAEEALACLDDAYTRLLPTEEFQQRVSEREDEDESNVFSRMFPHDIGYIRILSFSQSNVFQQVEAEVGKLAGCAALIIDLRDNGGGLIDETTNCCEFFVKEGTITGIARRSERGGAYERCIGFREDAFVVLAEKDGEKLEPELFMRRPSLLAGKPTVVLINHDTASSAELFASAVIENGKEDGLCVAIGKETRGKGIAQTTMDILGKAKLKISFSKFYSAKLEWLGDAGQRVANGIKPDIAIDDSENVNAPLSAAYDHLRKVLGVAAA